MKKKKLLHSEKLRNKWKFFRYLIGHNRDVRVRHMFITVGFQVSKTPDCAKHHIKLLKRPFKAKKRTNIKVVVC